jgi:hypothetical protein
MLNYPEWGIDRAVFLVILPIVSIFEETMNSEEIARKLSEYSYKELGDSNLLYYSYEDYWEKNRQYFVVQAEIYLRVKERLERQESIISIE